MGLDMWLYAGKLISSCPYEDKNEKIMNKVVEFMGVGDLYNPNSLTFARVELEVAYWRKFNELHNLFATVCDKDADECYYIYLGHEKLQEVFESCENNGFTETAQKLKKILELQHILYFVYRASW
jgi:hypothetical protein